MSDDLDVIRRDDGVRLAIVVDDGGKGMTAGRIVIAETGKDVLDIKSFEYAAVCDPYDGMAKITLKIDLEKLEVRRGSYVIDVSGRKRGEIDERADHTERKRLGPSTDRD